MDTVTQKSKRLRNPLADELRQKLAQAKANEELKKSYMQKVVDRWPELDTIAGGDRIRNAWFGKTLDEDLINFWYGLSKNGTSSAA